jgi:hypothetical protein
LIRKPAFELAGVVGQEPEGTCVHEDVVWTPYSGYLRLNAVTRDRSATLILPQQNDPGLPNPHTPCR